MDSITTDWTRKSDSFVKISAFHWMIPKWTFLLPPLKFPPLSLHVYFSITLLFSRHCSQTFMAQRRSTNLQQSLGLHVYLLRQPLLPGSFARHSAGKSAVVSSPFNHYRPSPLHLGTNRCAGKKISVAHRSCSGKYGEFATSYVGVGSIWDPAKGSLW